MRSRYRLPLAELEPYLLAPPAPSFRHEWAALFGNLHPVEVEVGFGKGAFLLSASQARPEVNFVGIELVRALQLYVATRLAKRALRNVRVQHGDARLFLRDAVSPASLQAIHVYFPDPWWKRRHKRRRAFTPEFAALCAGALAPEGHLRLATDVEDYFGVMTGIVAAAPGFERLDAADDEALPESRACVTNFERKAHEQGRGVWRASYRRTP